MIQPTEEVVRVIASVAKGDLSQTIKLELGHGKKLSGEFLRIAKVVNTMVQQLKSFSSEVTRVSKEVGTDGKLGGQAQVEGVDGIWKDLTDNVNTMAANLTSQVSSITEVITAVASGDCLTKVFIRKNTYTINYSQMYLGFEIKKHIIWSFMQTQVQSEVKYSI